MRELATCAGMSHKSVRLILHNKTGTWNVSSKFVSRVLTDEQKATGIEMCQWLLEMSEHDATLFSRIITRDESWIFKYNPSTEWQTMQWKHSGWFSKAQESTLVKIKREGDDGRVFRFAKCHHGWLGYCWINVNAKYYSKIPRTLWGQLYTFCISHFAVILRMFSQNTAKYETRSLYTFHTSCEFCILFKPQKNKPRNPLTFRANANPGVKCCEMQKVKKETRNVKKVTRNTIPRYKLFIFRISWSFLCIMW